MNCQKVHKIFYFKLHKNTPHQFQRSVFTWVHNDSNLYLLEAPVWCSTYSHYAKHCTSEDMRFHYRQEQKTAVFSEACFLESTQFPIHFFPCVIYSVNCKLVHFFSYVTCLQSSGGYNQCFYYTY